MGNIEKCLGFRFHVDVIDQYKEKKANNQVYPRISSLDLLSLGSKLLYITFLGLGSQAMMINIKWRKV